MAPRFIHLRVHSEYSLTDGLVQIKPLIAAAINNNMPAVALTDQGNLFAAIKFYQAALKSGIKPILGADLWLHNDQQPRQPFRFSLLCQNNEGYKNLIKLISNTFLQGQADGKPTIKQEWLHRHSAGLIALSGAHEGDLGHALLSEEPRRIQTVLDFWLTLFPNRYYIELQRTGRVPEETYIQVAVKIAAQYNVPIVATNDVRFLKKEDFEAHEARVCIHEGYILADPRRPKIYSEQQYFRSQADMATLFADLPSALVNTVEIAKRCNAILALGNTFLPNFPIPSSETVENYLSITAKKGLDIRLQQRFDHQSAEFASQILPYMDRLQTELNVINKMGFAGYFLIVADFIRWARDNDVPVGPGRGSGPGSLVAYALKITDLDPLAYDLLFERFLNPERVSLPDFDIDFCMEGRDRVIDYVIQTHGRDNVAQIITYGTMAARAVVRDVGRVLGMSYPHVAKIAALIPFELGITLQKALAQEPQLAARYQNEEDVKTLFDLALALEGITRNVGKHAGGVIIAPTVLTEYTPLYCEPNESHHLVTQYDKDDVETVGLVKFDFLGLRTLTIIDWAVREANIFRLKNNEEALDIHCIAMDDAATFQLLKACKTSAIFQLESRGMKDLVKRLQPDFFEEIIALVALFRPGPLQSGMVDDFIDRKHGRASVVYPHPKLEPVLRSTYGVILYQEQVMQIAQVLAGYTLGAADLLRRAMGKKKPEEMAKQREIFCQGAIQNGVDSATATTIFDLMEKFAGYGFNKSHSAAYALIAYQTAWLKTHYPAAYMAAVLSSDMDKTEKVVLFLEECHALGLKIAAPNINSSDYKFKAIDNYNLDYGLGAIKGAGQAAIEAIIEVRKQSGLFKDVFDFCRRLDLRKINRRLLEALIKAGAFDTISPHRASALASLDNALREAAQTTRNQIQGQQDLFSNIDSPLHTMTYVAVHEWPEHKRLLYEKETLGWYLSGHPIHPYLQELNQFTSERLINLRPDGNKIVVIGGIINQVRPIQTKRGNRMAVVTLEDGSAQIDMVCFPENYEKYRELLIKDNLIIAEGEIGTDDFSGSLRLLNRTIFSLDQAREHFGNHLKITIQQSNTIALPALKMILEKFKGGTCPITIYYNRSTDSARIDMGEQWRVRPTEQLITALNTLANEPIAEMVYS